MAPFQSDYSQSNIYYTRKTVIWASTESLGIGRNANIKERDDKKSIKLGITIFMLALQLSVASTASGPSLSSNVGKIHLLYTFRTYIAFIHALQRFM